ncbi:MAG: methyltransferase domain-containing protein, partial [Xanthobacteraceae bacterium]
HGKRPRYYLQNFHFQTGGWMTDDSASRYDTQVEVLFNGTANATRRQALPQLHEVFAGRDQRKLRLLDIGCGTGRFLDCLKQTWPRLPALGYEGLLELFPQNYHEPYYRSYTNEDFSALAKHCGLTHIKNVKAFVSKVMVFDKPA